MLLFLSYSLPRSGALRLHSCLRPPLPNPPHSGTHRAPNKPGYFEGWYVRICSPSLPSPFAFMYSLEEGDRGRMQVLGMETDELLVTREARGGCFPRPAHTPTGRLDLGQWWRTQGVEVSGARPLAPALFHQHILTGYQLSALQHCGSIRSEDIDWQRSSAAGLRTGIVCAYNLRTVPLIGWGADGERSTATWLSQLQIFEPGWQVLSAYALSSGTLMDWRGRRYAFEHAPTYVEKNWGAAFPSRWFWLQCQQFEHIELQPEYCTDAPFDPYALLTLTAVGAMRDLCLPGRPQAVLTRERIGMIGVHVGGAFWEFTPWTCEVVRWDAGWGHWHIEADGYRYTAVVEAWADARDDGALVLGPTTRGMDFVVRDGARGALQLSIRDRRTGRVILDARTGRHAAVEVGGDWAPTGQPPRWAAERRAFSPPLKALVYAGEGRRPRGVRV